MHEHEKLNNSDRGPTRLAMYLEEGPDGVNTVVINFGEDLNWVGFCKKPLRVFIDALEQKYNELQD